jgi:hypothetical protein
MQPKTHKILRTHSSKWVGAAYTEYTAPELGNAVGFFAKTSTMRATREGALKDIQDAENYLQLLREKTINQFDAV